MLSRRQLLFGGAALPCLAAPPPVKITRFDIHKVTLRWRDLVFLEVHTDAGLTGLGEATLETRADMVEASWEIPDQTNDYRKNWFRLSFVNVRFLMVASL